jgi:mRNA-degrading endonuclease YafQ of YafQ-DinJ toxin-antitoxin module
LILIITPRKCKRKINHRCSKSIGENKLVRAFHVVVVRHMSKQSLPLLAPLQPIYRAHPLSVQLWGHVQTSYRQCHIRANWCFYREVKPRTKTSFFLCSISISTCPKHVKISANFLCSCQVSAIKVAIKCYIAQVKVKLPLNWNS